jgi:hypothetical protein
MKDINRLSWGRKPQLLCAFFLSLSGGINAKDLGMFNGEPTPALAMYAAQVRFAADRCVNTGFVQDSDSSAKVLKYFNRGIQLRLYLKKDEEFASNYETFYSTYIAAWDGAIDAVRRKFCDGYSAEIAARESEGWLDWAIPLNYLRSKFSPITEESRRRADKIAAFASVAGAALTATAGISAAEDAVSSAKAGNLDTSNRQMAASRQINQTGFALVDMAAPSDESHIELISVLETISSEGQTHIVSCPVTDHFFKYAAPVTATVWTTYQRVSVKCRDPISGDLERVDLNHAGDSKSTTEVSR